MRHIWHAIVHTLHAHSLGERLKAALAAALFVVVSVISFGQASGLSQLDNNSLYYNWPNWIPDNGNSCSPFADASPLTGSTVANSGNQPVIVLDPGHSGDDISDTDPATGLYDHDYPNVPEISEVFGVAQAVQKKLQTDGYKVVMTKNSVSDDVSFRHRADIANQANAALAISIHDSHGSSWSNMGMGDGAGGQVYVQAVGDYRQNKPGMGSGTDKVLFTNSSVAALSQKYGQIFAQQRTQDEGHQVTVSQENFDNRAGLPSGNLPMVQLFATVPWVYNEVGAPTGPLSQSQLDSYAKGIIDSVEKAVPTSGGSATSSASSCCNAGGTGSYAALADASGGNSVWSSGLSAPYIIEEYAINVLEDLAQKEGKTNADAVTSQHVLALVAWAYIEGGDINNSSLFNLYNTGYSSPQLDAGAHTADGIGSYVSFDAGVEATTRTLASGHGVMASVLMDPASSALDFAHAESYSGTPSEPGTQEWAGAANSNPSGYFDNTWKPVLGQVSSNYAKSASLQIGTPAFELLTNLSAPDKLSNINSGGFSVGTASAGCSGSQSSSGIAQEALKLAWPEPFGQQAPGSEPTRTSPFTNTAAYQAALNQVWGSGSPPFNGADCGTFIGAVMRASGADPNYPLSGTGQQWSYVASHPDKYTVQYDVKDMSQLQPGDILIIGGPAGTGGAGHTWIYVGKQPGGYWSASASMDQRSANLTFDTLSDSSASGNYMLARLK